MLNALALLATIVVAFFAGVEAVNGYLDRDARRKTANVRISAIAYALRRQLSSWLQIAKGPGNEYERLQAVQGHFQPAEDRIADLLGLAADATPSVQEYLREAYVRFYRATQTINEQHDVGRRGNWMAIDLAQWPRWEEDVTHCIGYLDRVVEPSLENADSRLAADWTGRDRVAPQ